jgi:hypothetical protein
MTFSSCCKKFPCIRLQWFQSGPVAAGDLPPLGVNAVNVFSQSERILQNHVRNHDVNATELRDLIQMVLHHPDLNADEVAAELNKVLVMIYFRYHMQYHTICIYDIVCIDYDLIVEIINHAERGP